MNFNMDTVLKYRYGEELWCAITIGPDDNDWGTGSKSFYEAVKMAIPYIKDGEKVEIVVISDNDSPEAKEVYDAEDFIEDLELLEKGELKNYFEWMGVKND